MFAIRCWSSVRRQPEGVLSFMIAKCGSADDLTLFKDLHGAEEAAEWVAAYWERCDDPACRRDVKTVSTL